MPKVLIVDDALTDRVRISGIASKWLDCTILEADNGRTALEEIEASLPDLVLTDLHMPEMNGLELVAAVKDDFPQIPVILMTAQGSEDIAAEALRSGAASYVPKLKLADELLDTLNQVYGTAQDNQSQSYLMHYMTDTVTRFSIPNDRKLIRACVHQLLNMLRCLPLGDVTERLRVGIALQEAMNNAYYHGNLELSAQPEEGCDTLDQAASARIARAPFNTRRIHIEARICRDKATFIVTDDGPGFDVGCVIQNEAEPGSHAGRGVTLMHSIMNEVKFNDAGNSVTMVRHAVTDDDIIDDEDC